MSGDRQSFQDLPSLFAFLESEARAATLEDGTDIESR